MFSDTVYHNCGIELTDDYFLILRRKVLLSHENTVAKKNYVSSGKMFRIFHKLNFVAKLVGSTKVFKRRKKS